MTALQSCAGGWCTRRTQCGHYLASTEAEQPNERLCPRGRDGAAQQEAADMTRIRFSTAARVQQTIAVLTPKGVTTAQISAHLGVKGASRMSQVMAAAVKAGLAFFTFARVSTTMKTPERVYFPTAADRDAFRAAYDAQMAERERQRLRARYERKRSPEVAMRAAERDAARQQREMALANQRVARQAQASQKSESQQQVKQQREQRQRAAEAARVAKAERAATAKREKAETAELVAKVTRKATAARFVPVRHGTDSPKKPSLGPAFLQGPADESGAKVLKVESPTPAEPPKFFSAQKPGVYVLPVSRWAEAAAA